MMHVFLKVSLIGMLLAGAAVAQVDDVCREFGETPTRESSRSGRATPYIYGRVIVKGVSSTAKPPRVTVTYTDRLQPATRLPIGKSGNYCFKRAGGGGMLVVDVDGIEAARKSLSDLGQARQREDFEVYPQSVAQLAPPSVISTKFTRPVNEKTSDLYRKAASAEGENDTKGAIEYVRAIVEADPEDFIAWAKLGSLQLSQRAISEAETAFKQAVAVRRDYTPALLNLGIVNALQNNFAAAVDMFKRAVVSDPTSARAYRLLGEAYLQNRQGSLGLEALDEALRIDPVGMAECHLLKARLYDLAGAKPLATREYKLFLIKVTDHPDKKKLEKYIKDNPDGGD